MKLASHYLPLHLTLDLSRYQTKKQESRGTIAYYLQCIGGPSGLARLYLEAGMLVFCTFHMSSIHDTIFLGMLHLDGAASSLLASSHSSLSSLRLPLQSEVTIGGTEAWKRDREAAVRLFDRARMLQPELDIPTLPPAGESLSQIEGVVEELEMPSIELSVQAPVRRRRKREETALLDNRHAKMDDLDDAWYLYIPGLVGAGTALVLVGVIGALSFSSWSRRNQGS